jgi:hypothetical protein
MYEYHPEEAFQEDASPFPLRLALVPLAIPRAVPRCGFVDLGTVQFTVQKYALRERPRDSR